MSENAQQAPALIGPNAIIQLVPALGAEAPWIMQSAGVSCPDGASMIPEDDARAVHQTVRTAMPDRAASLLAQAGLLTADYILAHRIPRPAQRVLKTLPAALAAPLLARAIAAHAWTFAGSGQFTARSSWCFEVAGNPLIAGEHGDRPLCTWHAAVFERLYSVLVHSACHCTETHCGAQGNGPCRFDIRRG